MSTKLTINFFITFSPGLSPKEKDLLCYSSREPYISDILWMGQTAGTEACSVLYFDRLLLRLFMYKSTTTESSVHSKWKNHNVLHKILTNIVATQ